MAVRRWYFIFAAIHMPRIRKVIQKNATGCCPRRANASNASGAVEQANTRSSPFACTWATVSVNC